MGTGEAGRPLVTIVTPCLNPGHRLARCLESVATQTHRPVEHIVVDGGSTDGTIDLLRSRGVRFLSEPDSGQTAAINKGLRLARGELLGWLNADDALTPPSIEIAVGAIAASHNAGWVYGDNDKLLDGVRYERAAQPGSNIELPLLEHGNFIPQTGSLVTRWALERVGDSLDEAFDLGMDYDLWLQLLGAHVQYVYVPRSLGVYEVHDRSKTGTIHRSEFWTEWAHALLKNGHSRKAALMFGRAAAAAAQVEGARIDPKVLQREIVKVTEHARVPASQLDERVVRASAVAQAALFDLHPRPRGYRYLLRPAPWLVPETRRRLAQSLVHGLSRRMTGRGFVPPAGVATKPRSEDPPYA